MLVTASGSYECVFSNSELLRRFTYRNDGLRVRYRPTVTEASIRKAVTIQHPRLAFKR